MEGVLSFVKIQKPNVLGMRSAVMLSSSVRNLIALLAHQYKY
jgi:hypothetical protein